MVNKKIKTLSLSTLVIGCLVAACACRDEGNDEPIVQEDGNPIDTPLLPPVETNPPNTNYQPAFEGQTRVGGVETQTQISITEFASGLNNPWGMANLPDGRIIVTEKGGNFKIVDQSGNLSAAIGGLPAVNSSGQGGLLDVAVHPDFNNNRLLYWTFSQNGSGGTATAVAKGQLSNDESQILNAQVIFTALPEFNGSNHYGSRIVWDANDNLFISTGERSSASIRDEAQELDAALGKILHIDTNGNAVAGNPFIVQANALDEIYSYGHRNPQGMDRHPVTGELWAVEHGPRGGDEVNLIEAGKNYGWPVITYGIEYGGSPVGAGITQQSGMEQPIYYWDPSIAPCGASFYSGSLISEWTNNFFVTALAGQHLIRLVIQGNRVVGEERLLEGVSRFRDVLEGTDGALYVIESGSNAKMHRIGI
ncbi:MAG: glucose dehydrogenase [Flavobacteriales bacterium]|nr:glucose dehydrogenase [Flavobacteriales bacterium]